MLSIQTQSGSTPIIVLSILCANKIAMFMPLKKAPAIENFILSMFFNSFISQIQTRRELNVFDKPNADELVRMLRRENIP